MIGQGRRRTNKRTVLRSVRWTWCGSPSWVFCDALADPVSGAWSCVRACPCEPRWLRPHQQAVTYADFCRDRRAGGELTELGRQAGRGAATQLTGCLAAAGRAGVKLRAGRAWRSSTWLRPEVRGGRKGRQVPVMWVCKDHWLLGGTVIEGQGWVQGLGWGRLRWKGLAGPFPWGRIAPCFEKPVCPSPSCSPPCWVLGVGTLQGSLQPFRLLCCGAQGSFYCC